MLSVCEGRHHRNGLSKGERSHHCRVSGLLEQGHGADCLQRPLRSRFRQQLRLAFGYKHISAVTIETTRMYLFYIDESGDIGLTNSPTRYFALSALVVHELSWQGILQQLVNLRRDLRQTYGLKLRKYMPHIFSQNQAPWPGSKNTNGS